MSHNRDSLLVGDSTVAETPSEQRPPTGRADNGVRWVLGGAPILGQGHDPREVCAEMLPGGARGPCHLSLRKSSAWGQRHDPRQGGAK